MWSFEGGKQISPQQILDICINNKLEGLTIHGGEPLDQANGLLEVVNLLKHEGYTIVLFTGYLKKELNKNLNQATILFAGEERYKNNLQDFLIQNNISYLDFDNLEEKDIEKRNVYLQFRGSTNQRVYTHKGLYENYKVKDGCTTAILTMKENGELDVVGFLTEDIEELLNIK